MLVKDWLSVVSKALNIKVRKERDSEMSRLIIALEKLGSKR